MRSAPSRGWQSEMKMMQRGAKVLGEAAPSMCKRRLAGAIDVPVPVVSPMLEDAGDRDIRCAGRRAATARRGLRHHQRARV